MDTDDRSDFESLADELMYPGKTREEISEIRRKRKEAQERIKKAAPEQTP